MTKRILPTKSEDFPAEDVAEREQILEKIAQGNPRVADEIREELKKGDTKTRRRIQWDLETTSDIFDYYERKRHEQNTPTVSGDRYLELGKGG